MTRKEYEAWVRMMNQQIILNRRRSRQGIAGGSGVLGGGAASAIDSQGVEWFAVFGDSNAFGTPQASSSPPIPTDDTMYEFDGTNVIEIDAARISATSNGTAHSSWVKFAIDHNANTGRKVGIINCGVSGSCYENATAGVSWETNGTLYAAAVAKIQALFALRGISKVGAVFVVLGINDASLTTAEVQSLYNRIRVDFTDTPILQCQIGTDAVRANRIPDRKKIKDAVGSYTTGSDVLIVANNAALLGAGLYQAGSPHPTQAGYDLIGASFAKYFKYKPAGYSKWALSIICSLLHDPTETRRNLINQFITDLGTAYLQAEVINLYKRGASNDVFLDWAFLQEPQNPGGADLSSLNFVRTNGSATYFTHGLRWSSLQVGSLTDFIEMQGVVANRTASGTLSTIFGGKFSTTNETSVSQTTVPDINARAGNTTGVSNNSETSFQSGKSYGIARNGTTCSFVRDGVVIANAVNASAGTPSPSITGGLNTANTFPSATLSQPNDGDFDWHWVSRYTTVNIATIDAAFKALISAW